MEQHCRKKRIQSLLQGPGGQTEMESVYTEDMYRPQVRVGIVIIGFELFMIVQTLMRAGLWESPRRMAYFSFYVALLLVALVFTVSVTVLNRREPRRVDWQIRLNVMFCVLMGAWGCGVTLLDQYSGPNLNVYSYVLMAMSVLVLLRPWQSMLIFGGGLVALNAGALLLRDNPIFFRAPLESYNLLLNSLFLTIMTVLISATLFEYRVSKMRDRVVIQCQYDQISAINRQLNDLVLTDQLTGIGNRRFLEEKLEELRRQASEGERTVAGMMLDIDFFKQYNDNYGHQAGDVCLRQIADVMRCFAERENGFLARYGGEEFFLCLPGCRDVAERAEVLRGEIEAQRLCRDDVPGGCVTVSIGLCEEVDFHQMGDEELLRRCDRALYHAKNTGRNRVCSYCGEET